MKLMVRIFAMVENYHENSQQISSRHMKAFDSFPFLFQKMFVMKSIVVMSNITNAQGSMCVLILNWVRIVYESITKLS